MSTTNGHTPGKAVDGQTANDKQPTCGLSDEDITSMDRRHRCDYKAGEPPSFRQGAEEARDWFQAKITSGELMTKEQAEKMAEDAVERYKEDWAEEHFWDE